RMPALLALQRIQKDRTADTLYMQAASIINAQQVKYGSLLTGDVIPQLADSGFRFLYDEAIPEEILPLLSTYFFTDVAAFLHPVLLSSVEEGFFPENNQLYLAVIVEQEKKNKLFLVNVPSTSLPRFLKVKQPSIDYIVFLEDIIRANLQHVFPGDSIKGAYSIKINRDAELDLQDEYEEDLAEKIEKQLSKREFGFATRFLYEPGIPLRYLQAIIDAFTLYKASVVEGGKHHNLKDLAGLPVEGAIPEYPSWAPTVDAISEGTGTLYEEIIKRDRIVHTPYQSYGTILRFFNEAVIDPLVTEIYTTMYRVARDSRIAHALISAAKNGKKATVLVELKARFDEANNIRWAKQMKAAGVRIIYSNNALKVHAKVALVKREDVDHPYLGLLATGNLNENTARFYTDHILLTAYQPMLGEMNELFNFLSKRKKPDADDQISFKHLLVAQFNLLQGFLDLIQREIRNAQNGLPASITIKLNNLEEEVLINKLYEASTAGVTIQLIVRSICRLVPGIAGRSENIKVKRIVDRYLEHGRVFIFHNNGEEEIFMGSADWMNRNIYRRIEVCFPVYDKAIRDQVREIIAIQWSDNVQATWIGEELTNTPVKEQGPRVRAQERIYELLSGTKPLTNEEK
ncbi:MAG TPA: polyphosphate kinase 1, partial [Chitinophagaceae bacterium]|nr:polyphosphate kinase 1 [Chitinophagaceae bacterium]